MSTLLPTIEALGTKWWIEIFADLSPEKAQIINDDLRFFMTEFESKYSRFKADSLVSILNTTGRLEPPDPMTLKLLRLGVKLHQDTNGVFNFLVGQTLEHRGYDANYSFHPKEEPTPTIPDPEVVLSITDNLVELKAGKVDLGGYGKGYLIDLLVERLKEKHQQPFVLVNGGGDMFGTSDHDEPILIYLEHPTEAGTYIAETTLKDQGFAASSTHKRRWKVAGREYSHIVDTTDNKTSTENTNARGVYIKALSAVIADAWSTTLLISDPSQHQANLTQANIAHARFNATDNTLEKTTSF